MVSVHGWCMALMVVVYYWGDLEMTTYNRQPDSQTGREGGREGIVYDPGAINASFYSVRFTILSLCKPFSVLFASQSLHLI